LVKWDEPTWERKRQELASIARPVGAFPFPGNVAQDPLYWLRNEIRAVGRTPEAIPLLDRLIAAEPKWENYLFRGELFSELGKHGLCARDMVEATRLAGPRFWRWSGKQVVPDFAWRIAHSSSLLQEDYEEALSLVKAIPTEWRSEADIGTLLYRLGRYPEALEVFSRVEWERIGPCFVMAFAAPWSVSPLAQGVRYDLDTQAMMAMCLFRMGRPDAAKARLALARKVVAQEEWREPDFPTQILMGPGQYFAYNHWDLFGKAVDLIEGKKP
jgi:tetratricopeptide (TPR) repeat protein